PVRPYRRSLPGNGTGWNTLEHAEHFSRDAQRDPAAPGPPDRCSAGMRRPRAVGRGASSHSGSARRLRNSFGFRFRRIGSSDAEKGEGLEAGAEDLGAGATEPGFEERGVDPAEVGMVLEVPVVEVVEARVRPDQSGAGDGSDEEQGGRRAMVGAQGG